MHDNAAVVTRAQPAEVDAGSVRSTRLLDDEVRLVNLLAEGLPLEAIARRLQLSDRTVRRRSRMLCDRLGVRAPIQAVAWAACNGYIRSGGTPATPGWTPTLEPTSG